MSLQLDHTIIPVNDLDSSLEFYSGILGLAPDGDQGPFKVVRVTRNLVLLLAPFGTTGNAHYAFSMTDAEFDAIWARVRSAGIEYGDSFDTVGNMKGPGEAPGARGDCRALYFNDPNRHLIEIFGLSVERIAVDNYQVGGKPRLEMPSP